MYCRRKPHRGVVLLIVLSLLVLFLLLVVGFLIAAGQYRYASDADARTAVTGGDPRRLAESAFYILARDTNDPRSAVWGHGLLRDMWGVDGLKATLLQVGFPGQVGPVPPGYMTYVDGTNRQLIELRLTNITDLGNTGTTLNPTEGFYNGAVLTVTSGAARGATARIVSYDGVNGVFRVLPPRVDSAAAVLPAIGDRCIINGRPFGGTGFGYSDASSGGSGYLDRMSSAGIPFAILPNLSGHGFATDYLSGDADESYDAADFQNMALAAILAPNSTSPQIIPSFLRPDLVNWVYQTHISLYLTNNSVPLTATVGGATVDLHLWLFLLPFGADGIAGNVDDWPFSSGTSPSFAVRDYIRTIKRAMILRPLLEDNPSFDGSNSSFSGTAMFAGCYTAAAHTVNPFVDAFSNTIAAWDVDNDNDGQRDGIWIDVGFPPQSSSSGKLYKPLVSYLVMDLDGRFNVNAQGSQVHTQVSAVTPPQFLAGGNVATNLQFGQGNGPADVNLTSVINNAAEYQQLLNGKQVVSGFYIPGRYGASASPRPGINGQDLMSQIRFFDYPYAYFASRLAANHRSFSSPFDLLGEFQVGVDHRGQPLYSTPTNINRDFLTDNPYEFDLSLDGPRGSAGLTEQDQAFSVAELERILRFNDVDARTLPDRLQTLTPTTMSSAGNRRAVTTDSYDVPVPGVTQNYVQRLSNQLRIDQWTSGTLSASQQSLLNSTIKYLAAPDLVAGNRFDINRPFGNGLDDNNNQIVDEHWQGQPWATNESSVGGGGTLYESIWSNNIAFDHDNDGVSGATFDPDAFLARQHFARHLFILAMLLRQRDLDTNGDSIPTPAESANYLAQWAINVVDFRDADSIMTPFEYDQFPFTARTGPDGAWGVAGTDDDGNGTTDDPNEAMWSGSDDLPPWSVDGILGTVDDGVMVNPDRQLVWGCERPDLQLSEAIALHDLRQENLMTDPSGLKYDGTMMGDPHFDQRLRPRGMAAIELYNPSGSLQDRIPPEFYYYYDTMTSTWVPSTFAGVEKAGVILNKTTSGTGAGDPIWRLAFTLVDDPTVASPTDLVYFTSTGPILAGAKIHTTDVATLAPVMPGRYAVVGTYRSNTTPAAREQPQDAEDPATGMKDSNNDEYVVTMGRRPTSAEGGFLEKEKTRRLVLHPDADPDSNWVDVQYGSPADSDFVKSLPDRTTEIMPPVAIPILNFQLSEAVYPAADPNGNAFDPLAADGEGAYPTPYDAPLDAGTFDDELTMPDYKHAHLQRLANPLVPFDATTNPYITVDSMAVNLTVFNGVTTELIPSSASSAPAFKLYTRERGETQAQAARTSNAAAPRNIWQHEPPRSMPALIKADTVNTIPSHIFDEELTHTLGWLNEVYGQRFNSVTAPNPYYIGVPDTINADASFSSTVGRPFPWLVWNNRPFVSQYELMMVPYTSARGLTDQFSSSATTGTAYTTGTGIGHFSHLPNFFETSPVTTGTGGLDLYHLFEITGVPSRFVGAETWLNPTLFQQATSGTTYVSGTELLHPPFNRISNYREPGRVNVNTIYDDRVWNAVADKLTNRTNFTALQTSRSGYGTASTIDSLTPQPLPTIFGNPFRSSVSGGYVPLTSGGSNMLRPGIECTLLRSDSTSPPSGAAPPVGSEPLFGMTSGTAGVGAHNHPDRHVAFRYEQMRRLGNLVTTRSNVYAIWMTIGFFETDSLGRLGQEVGRETGEIKRHRAFYMFDRSIPVGFEPGENHNVDRAVMLRRFIE